jgi:hypothetical protein
MMLHCIVIHARPIDIFPEFVVTDEFPCVYVVLPEPAKV